MSEGAVIVELLNRLERTLREECAEACGRLEAQMIAYETRLGVVEEASDVIAHMREVLAEMDALALVAKEEAESDAEEAAIEEAEEEAEEALEEAEEAVEEIAESVPESPAEDGAENLATITPNRTHFLHRRLFGNE